MVKVLDHGYVNLVQTWGSDEDIIRAARMSTSKGFQGWGPIHEPWCENHKHQYCAPETCTKKPGDEKLLRYLWEHKHFSPFEMAGLVVEVQAPIFVFREWHRHRTQSYNELSARYTELPDLFYIPSIERLMAGKQGTKNKQGSAEGYDPGTAQVIQDTIEASSREAYMTYMGLIQSGIAREIARLVVPVNIYSRMRASANLRNWLGFLELRLGEGAQFEIREYAKVVGELVNKAFPRVWELFKEGQNGRS